MQFQFHIFIALCLKRERERKNRDGKGKMYMVQGIIKFLYAMSVLPRPIHRNRSKGKTLVLLQILPLKYWLCQES